MTPVPHASHSSSTAATAAATHAMSVCSINPSSAASSVHVHRVLKHKRRFCKAAGCERIVKSQGLCQRHGAKTRKCKVDSCGKQAQGNFDGMCKSHYKEHQRQALASTTHDSSSGNTNQHHHHHEEDKPAVTGTNPPVAQGTSVFDTIIPESLAWKSDIGAPMPLIEHLRNGVLDGRNFGWHRNEERAARGYWPIDTTTQQLEGWERELVWTEILLLAGDTTGAFADLAHGWGREKGFHSTLTRSVCERHGNLERNQRQRQASITSVPDAHLSQQQEEHHDIDQEGDATDEDLVNLWEDGSDEDDIPEDLAHDTTFDPERSNVKTAAHRRGLHSFSMGLDTSYSNEDE